VALRFVFYGSVRIHRTLRVTPATAAGLAGRPWEVADIVRLSEEHEAAQPARKRGPHRPRRPEAA
jgi:hypothetical protein